MANPRMSLAPSLVGSARQQKGPPPEPAPGRKTGQDARPQGRHDPAMHPPSPAVSADPGQPDPAPDRLAALLDWIERNLDRPLLLEQVARQAGLSPFHLSRLFSARMGRSVMAHVRVRRLLRAAQRLVHDPRQRLVDLALDSGFESQEAFTRAFARLFGVPPGRFRQDSTLAPLEGQDRMTHPMTGDGAAAVALLPGLVALPAFTVGGPTGRFDDASKAGIPQLWAQLASALPLPGQAPDWSSYGVVWNLDREAGAFDYLAGVALRCTGSLPQGFAVLPIPAARYAVFRITLAGGAPHPQIKAAMALIWGELLPGSGLRLAEGPDFERQDGRVDPRQPGAVIDFHIPVLG